MNIARGIGLSGATALRRNMLFWLVAAGLALAPPSANADLVDEHEEIEQQYPNVAHISANELEGYLGGSQSKVVLFDVRELEEFSVSHLAGAIHVDPDLSADQFLAKHGHLIKNKKAVFYCSVGYRSSHLAQIVQQHAQADTASAIVNLEHGLFGWHNEQRKLVQGEQATDMIHPYNHWWGRLLERKDLTTYARE